MSEAVRTWLEEGAECIRLWLESGIARPGNTARHAMASWLVRCSDAGWEKMARLGKVLLDDEQSDEKKAEAFLELCVRYEAVRSEFERMDILQPLE